MGGGRERQRETERCKKIQVLSTHKRNKNKVKERTVRHICDLFAAVCIPLPLSTSVVTSWHILHRSKTTRARAAADNA